MNQECTLSAGRKILVPVKAAHFRQPQSFGDLVLIDQGLTTEITQFIHQPEENLIVWIDLDPHAVFRSHVQPAIWIIVRTRISPSSRVGHSQLSCKFSRESATL